MSNTAQNWLDTKYKDKNSSGKIELYDRTTKDSEELTGELIIENYVNTEEISFTRWGKKGKITKVTITNCPQIKKIKLDNNEITEIIFKDGLPKLEWLDLFDNEIKEIDVSLAPSLKRLHLARNPNLVEIKGLENLTNLERIILLDTPGLNGKKFKEWKERPTKEELAEAVNDKAKEFKDYINPNDKGKIEAAAKGQGMVPKEENSDIKNKLEEWEKVFGKDKPPADIKKDLESKPATGGSSGTGAALPDNYTAMVAYLMKSEGSRTWKENLKEWEKKNSYQMEKAKQYLAQVEQKLI